MSSAIHTIVVVLLCVACVSHTRRLQDSVAQHQSSTTGNSQSGVRRGHIKGTLAPAEVLARYLLEQNAEAAFAPSGPGPRPMDVQSRLGRRKPVLQASDELTPEVADTERAPSGSEKEADAASSKEDEVRARKKAVVAALLKRRLAPKEKSIGSGTAQGTVKPQESDEESESESAAINQLQRSAAAATLERILETSDKVISDVEVDNPMVGYAFLAQGTLLFFALQFFFLNGAQIAGVPATGEEANYLSSTAVRVLTTASFIAANEFIWKLLPKNDWLLSRKASQSKERLEIFDNPLAIPGAAAIGIVIFVLVSLLTNQSPIPGAREFPALDKAFDKLLAAPAQEEVFFRAWLLRASSLVTELKPESQLGLSGVLFVLWHFQNLADVMAPGTDATLGAGFAGVLYYFVLGAYFAFVYQKSGGSLPAAIGTHTLYNSLITGYQAFAFSTMS